MDKKWWTLIAVCLGTFMLLLDVTIVNVALPDIQQSLHASFSDLQWVVDAYALSLAALLLTTGSLADLFGRRLLFVIGLVIFTAGSLLCGLAQSSEMLIISRAGQGVGGAIMFATSLALLAQAFQGRERGTAFGIWGSITGAAVAVGPVLGGVLTSELSWRWIFFVNVPIGVVGVIITFVKVDESRQPGARRPDFLGFLTFTASLICLVYAMIRSSEHGWTEDVVIYLFIAAAVLMVGFLIVERVNRQPMFELALFKKPTFVGGSIAAFALSASLFALLLYLVLYLQDILRYSALGTGLRLLILSGGLMVAATIAGRATARVPIRFLIAPGLVLVGVGLFLMSRLTESSSWTELIPGMIIAGVGAGLINPPLASTAVGVVEPARSGMASGINSTFRQVGIATGVAALGSILNSALTSRLGTDLANNGLTYLPAPGLAKAVNGGDVGSALAQAHPVDRYTLTNIITDSFVHGLDRVLLIGGILAAAGGVACLFLIRAKDFAAGSQGHQAQPQPAPAGAPDPVEQHQPATVGAGAVHGIGADERPAALGASVGRGPLTGAGVAAMAGSAAATGSGGNGASGSADSPPPAPQDNGWSIGTGSANGGNPDGHEPPERGWGAPASGDGARTHADGQGSGHPWSAPTPPPSSGPMPGEPITTPFSPGPSGAGGAAHDGVTAGSVPPEAVSPEAVTPEAVTPEAVPRVSSTDLVPTHDAHATGDAPSRDEVPGTEAGAPGSAPSETGADDTRELSISLSFKLRRPRRR